MISYKINENKKIENTISFLNKFVIPVCFFLFSIPIKTITAEEDNLKCVKPQIIDARVINHNKKIIEVIFSCETTLDGNPFSKKNLYFRVDGQIVKVIGELQSFNEDEKLYSIEIGLYSSLSKSDFGKIRISLLQNPKKILAEKEIKFPTVNKPYPTIISIEPKAGKNNDIIDIITANVDNNLENISVILKCLDSGVEVESEKKKVSVGKPLSIINLADNNQKITYRIPQKRKDSVCKENESSLISPIYDIEIMSGTLSSGNQYRIEVLPDNWKYKAILISLAFMVIFYIVLVLITKQINIFKYIVLDFKSNSYSLSTFQALIWSISLFFCYSYLAISCVIYYNGDIPKFNLNLLPLIGISYIGLIASKTLHQSKPKSKLRNSKIKAKLKDLITDNDEQFSLMKIQLLFITLILNFIYIYKLLQSNIFEGLPPIPLELSVLLGTSQSGYLLPEWMRSQSIFINFIETIILEGNEIVEVTLTGNGFTKEIRISIDDEKSLIPVKSITASRIKFDIRRSGIKNRKVFILPPSGDSLTLYIDLP